ncbi:MAG: DUF348 domain-containing protein, partial [Candidatus Syntrophonatronum acetioxidans]
MNILGRNFNLPSSHWVKDNFLLFFMLFCLLGAMMVSYNNGYYQKEITLHIEGEEEINLTTWKSTVGGVLEEAEISLSPRDKIYPSPGESLREDMMIYLRRAFPVYVQVGDEQEVAWTTGGTVQEILEGLRIEDIDYDEAEPPLFSTVENKMEIVVPNLERKYITQRQEIPYSTIQKRNEALDKGFYQVLQEGKPGIQEDHIEITKMKGEEAERRVVSTSIIEDKQDRVEEVGANTSISRGSYTLRFREALNVSATAYCSCAQCTGTHERGITATGKAAIPGEGT